MGFIRYLFTFKNQNKILLTVILLCFLISFALVHTYSITVGRSIYIRGYHIHHFYFGAVCLILGGILGLLSKREKNLYMAAGLIGVGMGLFADEIGLLLNCTSANRACLYAFPDNFDIIGYIVLIFVFVILFVDWYDTYTKRLQERNQRNYDFENEDIE